MTKGKKKKKKDKKRGKNSSGLLSPKVTKRLQEISQNPLVADVVAATLIGAASALRDSKKAHKLAANAGDELEGLAHRGARSGNAMWQLALDVGRNTLKALAGEAPSKPGAKTKKAASKRAAAPKARKSAAKSTRSPAKRRSARTPAG